MLPVVAVCVSNEDRLSVAINRCDTAPTPSGFAEIVSDDFPELHVDQIVPLLVSTQQSQNDIDERNEARVSVHDCQKIAVPASIDASARCFPNDQGLFALLHIAEMALESQMAKNPAPCATDDFYTRLRDSATGR